MRSYLFWMFFVVAIGIGLLVGWADSRPSWDDTGITVVTIFSVALLLSLARPERPWLWALAVGIWVPLFEVLARDNITGFIALPIAFAGAYLGAAGRKALAASSRE